MHKNSIYLLLLIISCSFAEAGDVVTLSPIMVTTATKTEKSIDGVTASIDVITADEIKKSGASTLKDVFNKLPAFTVQYGRFPHPSSVSKAGVSIRGAGANATLMLIDGRRISSETENPYEMDRIPASIIERIEVVKGSMSTLYGSDAIGGVINIITKKSTQPITTIDVKYGQNSHDDAQEKSINLSTMGKYDRLSYKFYGSILNTTPFSIDQNYQQQAVHPATHAGVADPINGQTGVLGVTYRDDSAINSIAMGLGYDVSTRTKFGFDFNYFNEDREGQYIGLHPKPRPDLPPKKLLVQGTPVNSVDNNQRRDISVDIEHTTAADAIIKARIYQSKYEKRNTTTALGFAPAPENKKFSADVTINGFEATSSFLVTEMNLITAGVEYREETRNSSAINPDPTSNEFVKKKVDYQSLFIQDEIEISSTLNAIVGARYDDISDADSKTIFNAGIIKNLNQGFNVRANFAQGFRAPDVAELYVVSPFFRDARRFGSEVIYGPKMQRYDLKPETSQTLEIAISKRSDKFWAELVLFHNEIKDKIALVAKKSGTAAKYYTSENLKSVKILGAEFDSSYQFNNKFTIGFNAALLDTTNKESNKELTFTPEISLAAIANYQLMPAFSSSLSLKHVGEQYTDEQNTQTVSSYTTLDLSLAYDINKIIEIYAGINNIGDTDIDKELGATVGRYFYAGIRSEF